MARAAAEMGSTNLVDLIRGYNDPYWGFAPKNFYAEFLAAVEHRQKPPSYFPGLVLDAPVDDSMSTNWRSATRSMRLPPRAAFLKNICLPGTRL